jgi:hypothetical protein
LAISNPQIAPGNSAKATTLALSNRGAELDDRADTELTLYFRCQLALSD